jgi:hypothetical protein
LAFLAPLSDLENCLLLVLMLRIPNSLPKLPFSFNRPFPFASSVVT